MMRPTRLLKRLYLVAFERARITQHVQTRILREELRQLHLWEEHEVSTI